MLKHKSIRSIDTNEKNQLQGCNEHKAIANLVLRCLDTFCPYTYRAEKWQSKISINCRLLLLLKSHDIRKNCCLQQLHVHPTLRCLLQAVP